MIRDLVIGMAGSGGDGIVSAGESLISACAAEGACARPSPKPAKPSPCQGPANETVDLAQQIAKLVTTEDRSESGEVLAGDALEEGKGYFRAGPMVV